MPSSQPVLFITPPFTQINTPYPATAFLKGYLNRAGIVSHQADLGLEVILKIFSPGGLTRLFALTDIENPDLTDNYRRIISLQREYISTIGQVIAFLQDKDPSVAHLICSREWLPEASRFAQTADLEVAFGDMGIHDKARHLATLYLEDISDLIRGVADPHFGFSRYAERLGLSPATFDELDTKLHGQEGFIETILLELLSEKMKRHHPGVVAITVPFPGNLYCALKCGQWMKDHFPEVTVVMGGGYASTELRSLTDPRIFDMVDFIILDDGEAPLLNLLEHLEGKRTRGALKRTFIREEGQVIFVDDAETADCLPGETGTPDYTDLLLDKYLPVFEMANPMHRLWSDGRWNRLTLAHGCYWAKCTFCDTTLSYIHRYLPNKPGQLCDRMEKIIAQTGHNGFHFVDEAAPPALLRELALEILRRDMNVCWWTNIRFEKNFSRDLCLLLKASGCIAVSGGLEVASDRILKLIHKGVSVTQAARVTCNFSQAGILVHTYLMYGFPTQTARETIDSLEVVRQLFLHGFVQSGFWHLFAMTVHSQVGINPEQFRVVRATTDPAPFANNDLRHTDPVGCDHEAFGDGLRKALFNYMHGICFEYPLQEWFAFPVPQTTVAPDFIKSLPETDEMKACSPGASVFWLGGPCSVKFYDRMKKGKTFPWATLTLQNRRQEVKITMPEAQGEWLNNRLPLLAVRNRETFTYEALKQDFARHTGEDFESFMLEPPMRTLRRHGLILL